MSSQHNTDPWSLIIVQRPYLLHVGMKVLSIILIPFRLLCMILLLVLCFLAVKIISPGKKAVTKDGDPVQDARSSRFVRSTVGFFARILLLVFGFVNIKVNDTTTKNDEEEFVTNIGVCNHSSYLDMLLLVAFRGVGFIAKEDVKKVPILASLASALNCIFVDRNDNKSRENTLKEIKNRGNNRSYTPFVVFPEGTTTNGQALIRFSGGAFSLGLPVRPYAIKYCFDSINPSWSNEGATQHLMRLLGGTIFNYAELTVLPIYHPSEEERRDPYLYAGNVQKHIALALQVLIPSYPLVHSL